MQARKIASQIIRLLVVAVICWFAGHYFGYNSGVRQTLTSVHHAVTTASKNTGGSNNTRIYTDNGGEKVQFQLWIDLGNDTKQSYKLMKNGDLVQNVEGPFK